VLIRGKLLVFPITAITRDHVAITAIADPRSSVQINGKFFFYRDT